jgi:hypothetical protein
MPDAVGAKTWVMTLGHIPPESLGPEPRYTSRDQLVMLNATSRQIKIEIEIFYADRDPVGPYRSIIEPRRLRTIRFNDLIDPLPIPLDEDFAALIRSSGPIVVQCSRFDSKSSGHWTVLPTDRFG